ncbi:MAG: hypothetical protein ACXWL9_03805 [Syntrophales bacterium]
MTYSFACPVPCDYEIKVHAKNNDEAVNAIIRAGAIRCRNIEKNCHCEKARVSLPPVTAEQLRRIVLLCMKEEYDASTRHAAGGMNHKAI